MFTSQKGDKGSYCSLKLSLATVSHVLQKMLKDPFNDSMWLSMWKFYIPCFYNGNILDKEAWTCFIELEVEAFFLPLSY